VAGDIGQPASIGDSRAGDLRAGVARAVITPPVGSPLIGFAARGEATGCHDELSATALVLESGDVRIALVACDLLYFRGAAQFKAAISQATGIPAERVLLTASHTHYGPALDGEQESAASLVEPAHRPLVSAYRNYLLHTLTGVVLAAASQLAPCAIGSAAGSVQIGINRREKLPDGQIILGNNPDGPCDRTVVVTRIDHADGRPLAALLSVACHGVSLGSECTEISADFPGTARELIERETGATTLFLQGAAGNINPVLMGWDWTYARRLGLSLGAEGARLFWTAQVRRSSGLAIAAAVEKLPPLMPGSLDEAMEELRQLKAEQDALSPEESGWQVWAQWRLTRAQRAADALRASRTLPAVDAELAAIRLTEDLAMITSPGEVFTELGQALVTQSPFPATLFTGYTNEAIGYVPTVAAYDEGGYEVTHSCYVARQSGALLQDASLRLLQSVALR
jgi:neutral ceramidase